MPVGKRLQKYHIRVADPRSYCDIKGPSHVAGNWDGWDGRDGGWGGGLIIVLFSLALHILASKCPLQGLPLERLANSQMILTWRTAGPWGLLKGCGAPQGPRGGGAGWGTVSGCSS